MKSEAFDLFLADALRCTMGRGVPPAWPSNWADDQQLHEALVARIGFHGIALALLRMPALMADWPQPVQDAVRAEGRSQSFWELGHREVTTRLVDALGVIPSGRVIGDGVLILDAYLMWGLDCTVHPAGDFAFVL